MDPEVLVDIPEANLTPTEREELRASLSQQLGIDGFSFLDEKINSFIADTNQHNYLSELVTELRMQDDYSHASVPTRDAIAHAHTYVHTDNLEDVLHELQPTPKISQAKGLVAFSKKDYVHTIGNMQEVPSTDLATPSRIPYFVALQKEDIPVTSKDKDAILGPILESSGIAKSLYQGKQLDIGLVAPYRTIQKLFE